MHIAHVLNNMPTTLDVKLACYLNMAAGGLSVHPTMVGSLSTIHSTIEEEADRREGKGRRCLLGDVLECHTSHFSSKDDFKKIFWKEIHFGRVVVWCGVNQMDFLKHTFCQESFSF